MKTVKKLKLNYLLENELDDKQKSILKGGSSCPCTCGGCGCPGWDGTGSMPPGQISSDAGSGSVSTNLNGTVNHGF